MIFRHKLTLYDLPQLSVEKQSFSEKNKALELARLIRRDKNLSIILSENKRNIEYDPDSILENLKIESETSIESKIDNEQS